jgi:hypothetical protein
MVEALCRGERLDYVGDWSDVWRANHPRTALPQSCPWSIENPPPGWSYANLQHAAGLSPFEIAASRLGGSAAREFVMPVLTTRVGLKFCQFLQFDDKWHDVLVNFGGPSRGVRPMEFCAYDLLSGSKIAHAMKPRLTDEDTGKRQNLNEREFRMLIAHIVCIHGWHKDGVWLMTEHGTAAIREAMAKRLSKHSDGLIRVMQGGTIDAAVHAGMWPGSVGGNFRFKALTEGRHALDHNALAALPGQVGHDGAVPEQIKHLDHYMGQIATAIAELPAERRMQIWNDIQKPLLDFTTYHRIVDDVYAKLDDRKWHTMEGWAQCGFRLTEFSLAPGMPWTNYDDLLQDPAPQRAAIEAFIQQNPQCLRVRNMSPREVANRHRHELTRLPIYLVPDILERADGFEITVGHDGLIYFANQYIGDGTHIFHATVMTPDNFQQRLAPGRKYWAHVLSFEPDKLFISDAAPVLPSFPPGPSLIFRRGSG